MKVLKWIGIVVAALLGVLLVAAVALYFVGGAKVGKQYDLPVAAIPIPTDAASVAEGQHMATIHMCTDCHGANLGGADEFTVPGLLTVPAPNLTSGAGGVGALYSDEDWVRAIRHGVGRDGRMLMIMPSKAFHPLGEKDLGDIIAWVKSVPPVDSNLPQRRIEPLARIMAAVGMFPPFAAEQIDHDAPFAVAPPRGPTAVYGEYLSHTCTECHGEQLNGMPFGPPGQEVPTPNLTPGGDLAGWSEAEFVTTLRTGETPSGHKLDTEMPWPYLGQMTDEELQAVWLYLQSLPALPQGG